MPSTDVESHRKLKLGPQHFFIDPLTRLVVGQTCWAVPFQHGSSFPLGLRFQAHGRRISMEFCIEGLLVALRVVTGLPILRRCRKSVAQSCAEGVLFRTSFKALEDKVADLLIASEKEPPKEPEPCRQAKSHLNVSRCQQFIMRLLCQKSSTLRN